MTFDRYRTLNFSVRFRPEANKRFNFVNYWFLDLLKIAGEFGEKKVSYVSLSEQDLPRIHRSPAEQELNSQGNVESDFIEDQIVPAFCGTSYIPHTTLEIWRAYSNPLSLATANRILSCSASRRSLISWLSVAAKIDEGWIPGEDAISRNQSSPESRAGQTRSLRRTGLCDFARCVQHLDGPVASCDGPVRGASRCKNITSTQFAETGHRDDQPVQQMLIQLPVQWRSLNGNEMREERGEQGGGILCFAK